MDGPRKHGSVIRLPIRYMAEETYYDHHTERMYGLMAYCLPVIRERNVLFSDALSTFYLRLYAARHMVKNHALTS